MRVFHQVIALVSDRRLLSGAVLVLTAAVVAINLKLAHENAGLRAAIAAQRFTKPAGQISELIGANLNGQRIRVTPSSGKRCLVLTISANCPYCKASVAAWKRLLGRLNPQEWDVLWVSRDSIEATADFVRNEEVDGIVLADVPLRTYALAGLAAVPKTIVLSSNGRVLEVVDGQITKDREARLTTVLGLGDEPSRRP